MRWGLYWLHLWIRLLLEIVLILEMGSYLILKCRVDWKKKTNIIELERYMNRNIIGIFSFSIKGCFVFYDLLIFGTNIYLKNTDQKYTYYIKYSLERQYIRTSSKYIFRYFTFIRSFYFSKLVHRYWQPRIESSQLIVSNIFLKNIPVKKVLTVNILGVSSIWKLWKVSNAIRCSTLIG